MHPSSGSPLNWWPVSGKQIQYGDTQSCGRAKEGRVEHRSEGQVQKKISVSSLFPLFHLLLPLLSSAKTMQKWSRRKAQLSLFLSLFALFMISFHLTSKSTGTIGVGPGGASLRSQPSFPTYITTNLSSPLPNKNWVLGRFLIFCSKLLLFLFFVFFLIFNYCLFDVSGWNVQMGIIGFFSWSNSVNAWRSHLADCCCFLILTCWNGF